MRIRKYDFDYGRRALLEKAARGITSAGVLAPLWPIIANGGDVTKAYPDELVSIEAYTKGKIKPGDVLSAANVEHVKDLVSSIVYTQVRDMGRRITIQEPLKDVTKLFPQDYLEATLKNKGKAKLDEAGNIVTQDGAPWIGGNPFPEPKTGYEAMANITLSWGRHDYSQYALRDWDLNPAGEVAYQYDFMWCEMNTTGRLDPKGPVWNGRKDLLRYQSVFFTAPNDVKGSSFLNIWKYDQREFPELYGYFPAFKRVRQFPTNQRFEPLVPGIALFLSDAWGSGDPLMTWGDYKILKRMPFLGAMSRNWYGGRHANWERPVHGGPKNQTFFDTAMEFIPECLLVESTPTGYPRAPVGRRELVIDVRNGLFPSYLTYDRRGKPWKNNCPSYSVYEDGKESYKVNGVPSWSFTSVMFHDIQANRLSRFVQAKQIAGGYPTQHTDKGEDVYNRYLTNTAIQRLGK
jgi:hypothetical protein